MKTFILFLSFLGIANKTIIEHRVIYTTFSMNTNEVIKVTLDRVIENLEYYDNKMINVTGTK